MTPSNAIASNLVCPLCELISPPGTSKCECGYDFVRKHPPLTGGHETSLSYRQRLRVGWFLLWRWYVFGIFFGPGGVPLRALHYEWKIDLLGLLLAFVFVATSLLFLRYIFNAMFRGDFKLFKIRLWQTGEPHVANNVSMKETVKLGWLFLWRTGFWGGIAVGSFVLIFGGSSAVPQILYWLGLLLAGFVGAPWAIRAMLQKEFRGFRVRAVRTENT
jgi:hypothetical protein